MRSARLAFTAALFLGFGGVCLADSAPPGKVNGDGPGDSAPLAGAGANNATNGAMAHENTPPIGGATQGGGGNPKESGPIDANRSSSGAKTPGQPDNH